MTATILQPTQLALFDYESLDSETRIVVSQRTTEIKSLLTNIGNDVISVGEKLSEVRDKLASNGGNGSKGQGFEAWLKHEFDWSKTTAYRYISIFQTFGDNSTRSIMGRVDIGIQSLSMLASPTFPEALRDEILERGENGEKITPSLINQSRKGFEEQLKALNPGEIVRLNTDRLAFVVENTGKSVLLQYLDEKSREAVPLKEIKEIIDLEWAESPKNDVSGSSLGDYRGFDIFLKSSGDGSTFERLIVQSDRIFVSGVSVFNLSLAAFGYQAKKFIDKLLKEDEELLNGLSIPEHFWEEYQSNEELIEGDLIDDYRGFEICLIKDDFGIAGIQIFSPANDVVQCFTAGLAEENPIIRKSKQWHLQKGRDYIDEFLAELEDEEEKQEDLSPKELQDYQHSKIKPGHLHATPRNRGENTPPHPAYDRWGIQDTVRVGDRLGIITQKNAHDCVILFQDLDGNESTETVSYSELTIPYPQSTPEIKEKDVEDNPNSLSESVEWYTPTYLIEKVRLLMGEIDLDPASCSKAQKIIKAKDYYTIEGAARGRDIEDGLKKPWEGRVFLNPPYGKEIGRWTERLAEGYQYGKIPSGIALVPAYPDTQWFRFLANAGNLICFHKGRVHFWNPETPEDKATPARFPSAIIYLGNDKRTFKKLFSDVGMIWQKA